MSEKNHEVYIAASKQFFKVLKRSSAGHSRELSYEEANTLSTIFNDNGIPYKNDISLFDCETAGEEAKAMDAAPSNSRAVVEINGQEYNILNFNCHLMKEWYAEKLKLAFSNRGFTSRVELVGRHVTPSVYRYRPPAQKERFVEIADDEQPKKDTTGSATYRQMTLLEYMGASR